MKGKSCSIASPWVHALTRLTRSFGFEVKRGSCLWTRTVLKTRLQTHILLPNLLLTGTRSQGHGSQIYLYVSAAKTEHKSESVVFFFQLELKGSVILARTITMLGKSGKLFHETLSLSICLYAHVFGFHSTSYGNLLQLRVCGRALEC